MDGKVAHGTHRLQHTSIRALVSTPTPMRQDGQQGQAACSASTEPYMQLVSLSASNKAGSSDSPLVGEATEARQRGTHRGRCPASQKFQGRSYGEPCLPQPRLASSSSGSPGCNPSRVSGNASPARSRAAPRFSAQASCSGCVLSPWHGPWPMPHQGLESDTSLAPHTHTPWFQG